MASYNVEYRILKKTEDGTEVTWLKKVVSSAALATLITTVAAQDGIEFFTVRLIKPKPEPKVKEVKK